MARISQRFNNNADEHGRTHPRWLPDADLLSGLLLGLFDRELNFGDRLGVSLAAIATGH